MKKTFIYAMLGAIALTGATTVTSCTSTDDVAEVNPTYNEQKKEVTTQFVLNVASNTGDNVTRQGAVTVQKNNNFRGMADAKLIGLSTGKANTFLAPYLGEATSGYTVCRTYDLGTLYASTAVDNSNANDDATSANRNSSSRRVVELTLPLTTDAMLVYGRAIPPSPADYDENGQVTVNIDAAPENTTFDLNARVGDNLEAYNQTCELAALILNRIMLSQKEETPLNPSSPIEVNNYNQTEALPALSWRGLGTKSDAEIGVLPPLQMNLAQAYKVMTSYSTASGEMRAGSAAAILSQVKDLYAIANSVESATATSQAELNAQLLAREIKTRISNYFEDPTTTIKFKTYGSSTQTGSIVANLIYANAATANDFASSGKYAKVTETFLKTFPLSFNLPDGVSQLYFTPYATDGTGVTGGFSYTNPSQSLIDIANTQYAEKYMYPAELLYFDNSLLRVNDADKAVDDYPNGYYVWDTDSWTGWKTSPVVASTRSVAVKNNINYGVAMLESKVALASDVTVFKDNRGTIVTTEEDQELTETEVKKLQLTGILIGGQYKQLGWNYLAKSEATANGGFVIYDKKVQGNGAIPTAAGEENYTLVFDNYTTESTQNDVLIALEFKNNTDKDFYGKGNMIPAGSTFYLAAKLQMPTNPSITWDQFYAVPPYTTTGASTETPRIFIQDYVTTATFKIGAESLKSAYSTVPDLRATQTSLGLSVDLKWRPGLSFETVLGQ